MALPLLIAAVVVILTFLWLKSRRPKKFPPGPPAIPFLGNIFSLRGKPAVKILEWKEKYGDIFGMFNGRKRVVVISDFYILRKLFGEEAASGRVLQSSIRDKDSSLPIGIGLISSQGDLWKTHRRFALSTLRDLGMGKNWMEDTIIAEVEGICQALRETKGKPFNPKVQLTNSVSNVICALIFGKRFELTDPKFSQLTNLIAENIAILKLDFVAQTAPFVLWFPNAVRTQIFKARRNISALTKFMKQMIKEHVATSGENSDAPDYLYAYQQEKLTGAKTDGKESFNELQLVGSLFDLFAAGTETTSTTILWMMVFMIENPDVMEKVQREIDDKVGRQNILTNSDRPRLPYTEAVILEVQRCGNLVPLGVPHQSREDIQLEGYTIPKDTLIIANLFSIHRDPRYWKNPEKFDPTRFLDENDKLLRPDGFVPFSIGKRACLGEALAKMELFLFIANLLRCFTLELPKGKTLSHNDYQSSIVNSPDPFELVFVPRF